MPLLVGQRINGEGSRRAKRLLLAGDYDGIAAMAREQLDAGADLIQLYTGFIYEGPGLVRKINQALLKRSKL